jgi:hypothetical protein
MGALDRIIYGNPVRQWLLALGVAVLAYVAVRVILYFVRGRVTRLTQPNPD